MKIVLIAFHFFMVLIYLAMGGILIFTLLFPFVTGISRIILGLVLWAYAGYRGYTVYRNFINRRNGF